MTTTTIPCTGKTCLGDRTALAGTMLCRRCTGRLEQHLAETPARCDQLQSTITTTLGVTGGISRGSRELPVPINVAAYDELNRMTGVLTSWASLVRDERGLQGPDSNEPRPLSTWLLSQLPWLLEQPWVDELEDELGELARAADIVTGRRALRNRLEPACPRCGARELGRDDGADQVDCAACGSAWEENYYPALVRLALDDSGGCLTAAEAAQRLETTVGAFRNYVHRGRVRKLGTVDGQARYSASDVDALLDEQQQESA